MIYNYYLDSDKVIKIVSGMINEEFITGTARVIIPKTSVNNFANAFAAMAVSQIPHEYLEQITDPTLVSKIIVDSLANYAKDKPQEFHKIVFSCRDEAIYLPYIPGTLLRSVFESINREIGKRVFEPDIEGYRCIQAFNRAVYTHILTTLPATESWILDGTSPAALIYENATDLEALTKWLVSTARDLAANKYPIVGSDKIPEVIFNTIKGLFTYFSIPTLLMSAAHDVYKYLLGEISGLTIFQKTAIKEISRELETIHKEAWSAIIDKSSYKYVYN